MPQTDTDLLNLAALRCTPALLDGATLYVRRLDEAFSQLWWNFETDYKDHCGREEVQAPRTIATTALQAYTGGNVHFDPRRNHRVLVSLHPIDDATICDAFTLMHGLAMGQRADAIDLNRPVRLAEKLAGTPQQEQPLAGFLGCNRNGQPDVPGWVFDTITWHLARRLAAAPFRVDGQEIAFLPDTTGGLIAWDRPWFSNSGRDYALCRMRLRLKTIPNVADPVLLFSGHATRISKSMNYTTTVLARQPGPEAPILEVPLDGRGKIRRVPRMALATLDVLKLGKPVLQAIEDRIAADTDASRIPGGPQLAPTEPAPPGDIRPVLGKNFPFGVGHGAGMPACTTCAPSRNMSRPCSATLPVR